MKVIKLQGPCNFIVVILGVFGTKESCGRNMKSSIYIKEFCPIEVLFIKSIDNINERNLSLNITQTSGFGAGISPQDRLEASGGSRVPLGPITDNKTLLNFPSKEALHGF